ncbi:hypothetical protein LTR53_002051 [Teratosphaeriaceae sp. CCFEE 6253]|nr:hypothetical protein LTR53_002051 [Teratosphaeriaceae sp. CCFEE 6253]
MARTYDGATNGNRLHNQEVHTINISTACRDTGTVTNETIAEAIAYLHRDGILILENAIDPSHLDDLEAMLGPEAQLIAEDPDHHFNFGKETRNMDQAPPLIPELMYKDIWANPVGVAVMTAVFGSCVCHYANRMHHKGNTALKATGRQPVHSDIEQLHPLFPFAYAFNIPLCDTSLENGSTEVWVGSHRDSNIDQHCADTGGETGLTIRPELLAERRRHSPPIQPTTKKGSLIIRDIRLSQLDKALPSVKAIADFGSIVLRYQPRWFEAPSKVTLPLKAKPLVEQWQAETGVEYNAHWVDGDVDHKKINSGEVDFSTRNKRLLELEDLMHLPVH